MNQPDSFQIIVFSDDENSEPFDEEAHNALVVSMDNMNSFYDTGDQNGY